jgi:alpha-L-rhamnosidase
MEEPMPAIVDLRCQLPDGVTVIGREPVRLTWQVVAEEPGARQEAYEIEVSDVADFERVRFTTGPSSGDAQVAVEAPGGALWSREVRFYRVRIQVGGSWTDWSPLLRIEAGLLRPENWKAEAVTLPEDPGATVQSPAPLVRREFTLAAPIARARLYVTSLGIHEAFINGQRVGDALLSPGWTSYRKRLLYETHDVTTLLTPGRNVIAAVLGDGWYRGRIGWDARDDRCRYGDQLGLIAQLEIQSDDGSWVTIVSDGQWQASTGEIRRADLYDGCEIDLRDRQAGWTQRGFAAEGWLPVRVVPWDRSVVEPRVAPPVRVIAELPVTRRLRPGSALQLDGGQNISGFVRLRVRGQRDAQVRVRHAEVLEADGSLHTTSLRSARATDDFILADDQETILEPRLTFHGFRYAEVETEAEILDATIVAISSDTPPRSSFSSSHELLDRFHENVVWSQRGNFVSVPTDCPQRDERLGWTGDAQAFAPTGSTLFDSRSFWASWLRDVALDQDDRLGVPSVVPDVVIDGAARFGRAGWADAATIVPWAVYEAYGDVQVLRDQLGSMRRHVDSLRARLGPGDLLVPSGMQFGDWLDPDAPVERPWEAKADSDFLANAFLVLSARLAADAAELCGDPAWAADARALAARVRDATWGRWAGHAVTSQTGCAVALCFEIAAESERSAVADALAEQVRASDGRVRTGFLGTPLVLPALAQAGRWEEAYLMLLREDVPSWLYQVRQGATTVWERWDAIRPDGSIHPGTMSTPPEMADRPDGNEPHMLSFNHYAYGAVIDWVYRHLVGLASDRAMPGYRHVVVAPQPAVGIQHARATIESAYGRVSARWEVDASRTFMAKVELPFGTSATFVPPATGSSIVVVDGSTMAGPTSLGPGRHEISVSAAHVIQVERPADALSEPHVASGSVGRGA